eukprot:GEMP01142606.1.p1 GENE.GEMP01142606.1~~GEMP01142606.1.p1  ORF type:complete len:115 (+),score=11.29 GEMP01142606.1:53-397(+)
MVFDMQSVPEYSLQIPTTGFLARVTDRQVTWIDPTLLSAKRAAPTNQPLQPATSSMIHACVWRPKRTYFFALDFFLGADFLAADFLGADFLGADFFAVGADFFIAFIAAFAILV